MATEEAEEKAERAAEVQVRERSSEELCGPHIAISPVMLRSSNKASALRRCRTR